LKSVRFETKPWHAEEEDVVGFLKVVTDTNNLPVFVHCQRGADRTGLMCAMYRIVVCGWSKSEAIDEMKNGGFNFNPAWHDLVSFIEKADIADIKRRVFP
jgi:protein tyrosine/serine phosphatase